MPTHSPSPCSACSSSGRCTRAGWLLALAVFCAWFATRAFRTYQRSA